VKKKTPKKVLKKKSPRKAPTRFTAGGGRLDSRTIKVKHKIHWTGPEDELVQKLREKGETWSEVSKQVSALGVCARSGATCLQRSIYLGKTRPKGFISMRSVPSEGLSVTLTFPGIPDTTLQTRRTLKEILAFFRAKP
jgi:hypothetical protein